MYTATIPFVHWRNRCGAARRAVVHSDTRTDANWRLPCAHWRAANGRLGGGLRQCALPLFANAHRENPQCTLLTTPMRFAHWWCSPMHIGVFFCVHWHIANGRWAIPTCIGKCLCVRWWCSPMHPEKPVCIGDNDNESVHWRFFLCTLVKIANVQSDLCLRTLVKSLNHR